MALASRNFLNVWGYNFIIYKGFIVFGMIFRYELFGLERKLLFSGNALLNGIFCASDVFSVD